MSEAACAHTKIKEISWHENYGQSSKFMCLDCNTDFVQVTPDIREFMWARTLNTPAVDKRYVPVSGNNYRD